MRNSMTGFIATGLLLSATTAANAFPIYMDMTGASKPPPSSFAKSGDWIAVQSISWGSSHGYHATTSSTLGAGAGKSMSTGAARVSGDAVTVTMLDGKMQAALFQASASGKMIPIVHILMTKSAEGNEASTYLITLRNVIVASDKWSASATGRDVPVATVDLVYTSSELEQVKSDTKTSPGLRTQSSSWNVTTNKLTAPPGL